MSTEGKCGGAVEKRRMKHQDASSQNILRRTMRKTKRIRTMRIELKKKGKDAFVVKNKAIEQINVTGILT